MARLLLTFGLALYGFGASQSGLDRISRNVVAMERLVAGPFRSEAHRARARAALSRAELRVALSSARSAVESDPIDPASTALLGMALLGNSEFDGAADAFRVAARFGWRNLATQAYWFKAAIDAEEFEVAMDRADAILRTHDMVEPGELLADLEGDPRGRAVLAAHLQHSPDWLSAYLVLPADVAPRVAQNRVEVVNLAADRGSVLGCDGVLTFASDLMREGRYNDAREIWNQNCPDLPVPPGLTDPKFEHLAAQTPLPFGWQTFRSGDVSIGIDGEGERRSLVLINRASVSRIVLRQAVNLPNGLYRVEAEGGADAAQAVGVSWTCGGAPQRPLPQEMNLSGSGQGFRVSNCSKQTLSLWLAPTKGAVRIGALSLKKLGK